MNVNKFQIVMALLLAITLFLETFVYIVIVRIQSSNEMLATIQGDGNQPGEKELNDMIKKIDPTFRGFPSWVGYKNGKYVKSHEGKRDAKSLQDFCNSF
jgi:hypothetical protein